MSFPGVIERPLLADEFSIYLDNTIPIPLSSLATFLKKIDKAAHEVRGMEDFLIALSDFALGSNELRFRIVSKNRQNSEEESRQKRALAASEKSAKAAMIGAGAAVVSAVTAVVAVAITSGAANPSTYKITNEYNVATIYVRAPDEQPYIINRDDVEHGRQMRLSKGRVHSSSRLEVENDALMIAMNHHQKIKLAGKFYKQPDGGLGFRTMIGNKYPAHFKYANGYEQSPVALEAIVRETRSGPYLDIVEIIAELSDI